MSDVFLVVQTVLDSKPKPPHAWKSPSMEKKPQMIGYPGWKVLEHRLGKPRH